MINSVIIMGRFTRDPELRHTQSGKAVTSFTIAVDRPVKDGEKKTDFIDCVAWGNTAEFVSEYLSKGRMVVVAGSLHIREWMDKEGNKRRNAEVLANVVRFADSRREAEHDALDDLANSGFAEVDDENLPF